MARVITSGQTQPRRIVRFGAFELDIQSGELRKHGLRIKLQGQPVNLLTLLLERPGEVVTREELQKGLWPSDTHVDFETSLNAAVKRLRAALRDTADSPRFVETVARRGYRFIAPISPASAVSAREPASEPQSVKPVASVARNGLWTALKRRSVAAGLMAVFAAVMLTVFGWRGFFRSRSPFPPVRSLAVLPLADVSSSGATDYLADEITDAVRQRLADIHSIRVISRTSSVRYQWSTEPIRQIAEELNVDAVVTGSVERSGDRFRISIELIQANTDTLLWTRKFETDVKGISELQDRIAASVADEARAVQTPEERAQLSRPRSFNPDAYDAYSRGRVLWNKRTEEGMMQAIGEFKRATEIDPNYPLAWDGIADSWVAIGWYGYRAPSEAFPNAKEALGKALALDVSRAEPHTTLAFVSMYWDRDWDGAEREFRRAVELNPNYANGHHWYGEFLTLRGRHEEAIAEAERARELDPLSSIINAWVGSRYFFAGQYDKAINLYRGAVEMDPKFMSARLVLGQAYEQVGRADDAISELQTAMRLSGGSAVDMAALTHAYGVAGRRREAEKLYRDLEHLSEKTFVSAYDLGIAAMGLGEPSEAMGLLEKAYTERSPRVSFIALDHRFDGLRAEPRFQRLKLSLGLP